MHTTHYIPHYGYHAGPLISDEAAYAMATGDERYLKNKIEEKERANKTMKDHPEYFVYGIVGLFGIGLLCFFILYLFMRFMDYFFD